MLILLVDSCTHTHIVQADLALMALASSCLGAVVILLRTRQILCLLLVHLLRVALLEVRWTTTCVCMLARDDAAVAVHLMLIASIIVVEVVVQLN